MYLRKRKKNRQCSKTDFYWSWYHVAIQKRKENKCQGMTKMGRTRKNVLLGKGQRDRHTPWQSPYSPMPHTHTLLFKASQLKELCNAHTVYNYTASSKINYCIYIIIITKRNIWLNICSMIVLFIAVQYYIPLVCMNYIHNILNWGKYISQYGAHIQFV